MRSVFHPGCRERIVLNLDNWNEVPPCYAGSLRSGDSGGVELH